MKTLMKVSRKVQRIIGTLSRMRSRMSITFKCIFSEEDHLWFLLQKGNIMFLTFIHVIYRKYHISMYFLRKIIFHFPSKEKISYFPEKNTIFSDDTKKSIFQCDLFFGKTIFPGHLKKISYFHVFFWERSSFIFRLKNKIIFSGKRNIIFPDNTTRKIIFQCYFFGKSIFSEHLNKISNFHVFFWERSSFIFRLTNRMISLGKRNIIFPDNTRKTIFQRDSFWNDHLFRTFGKKNIIFRAVLFLLLQRKDSKNKLRKFQIDHRCSTK